MAIVKINKKALYESLLKEAIASENYEGAANVRDIIPTIDPNEEIEYDDSEDEELANEV